MRKSQIILSSLVIIVILGFAGLYYYQETRFNANITINHIRVGGLTPEQAIHKLQSAVSKNVVYVGATQVFDGKDTTLPFTIRDRTQVQQLLRQQRTIFPSSHEEDNDMIPRDGASNQIETMKAELADRLQYLNKSLRAPVDAEARLEHGKIIIAQSKQGLQYDVTSILKEYQKQEYNSEIHLQPVYVQPMKADNPIVQKEKKKLETLAQRTVDYKVQNKVYAFQGRDIINNATVLPDMKLQMKIDTTAIKEKLREINRSQSTLHKNYTFTTHSGSVLSVKGQSYGWAINVDEEAKRIQEAFVNETPSILAYNVYGMGWNINGVGYHTTANHGLGDTYVELSIQDQRIWVFKNGALKVTTPVVTGTHVYKEDTPKGVWYIEYKQAPSVLKGSEVGNPNYSVKVAYWAPFTLSGCGFHDADWRKNWSSNAYIKYGSGGCVNTPPSIMKTVYDNLTQYEPVVIY